ncbi:hypothetical protein MTO96_008728 [Rhipicephalus appendiculatus]
MRIYYLLVNPRFINESECNDQSVRTSADKTRTWTTFETLPAGRKAAGHIAKQSHPVNPHDSQRVHGAEEEVEVLEGGGDGTYGCRDVVVLDEVAVFPVSARAVVPGSGGGDYDVFGGRVPSAPTCQRPHSGSGNQGASLSVSPAHFT